MEATNRQRPPIGASQDGKHLTTTTINSETIELVEKIVGSRNSERGGPEKQRSLSRMTYLGSGDVSFSRNRSASTGGSKLGEKAPPAGMTTDRFPKDQLVKGIHHRPQASASSCKDGNYWLQSPISFPKKYIAVSTSGSAV